VLRALNARAIAIMALRPITHPRASNIPGKLYLSAGAFARFADSSHDAAKTGIPRIEIDSDNDEQRDACATLRDGRFNRQGRYSIAWRPISPAD